MSRAKTTAALLLIIAGPIYAQDMPREAQPCVTCHGEHGEGTEQAPAIAGLSEAYIEQQIENFIAGRRSDPLMTQMAESYADPQLRTPAIAYFAAQGSAPKLQIRGQHSPDSPGEKLYYQGDLSRNIPACYSCHGPSAVGGGPFPRLAGQQPAYLSKQLTDWQKGERSGDPDDMMANIAKRLNEQDIQAVTSYLAGIR